MVYPNLDLRGGGGGGGGGGGEYTCQECLKNSAAVFSIELSSILGIADRQ